MAASTLREQLLTEIDKLSPDQQEQMLAYAKSLSRPRGAPARSLLIYAGRIPLEDVQKMEQAIEACE
jgi:hypothetical protein